MGVFLIGMVGQSGNNGNTILNAAVDPASTDGSIGDFFINTATSKLFGPKTAGGWPAGVFLIGNQGFTGRDGRTILNGTGDPTAFDGSDRDFYINTTTNTLFGPKIAGAWPAVGVSLVGPAGSAVVAPEIFSCFSGAFRAVNPSPAARTIFCDFGRGDPSASGTVVALLLPAASSYPSGTVVTFRTTNTVFLAGGVAPKGVPAIFTFQSPGSTYTGYATSTGAIRDNVPTSSPITLFNNEGALFSVMAVGSRWYQLSP